MKSSIDQGTRELNSFPPLWKEVASVCNIAFQKVKKRPSTSDLGKDYNELIGQICNAYGLVYDLTAYECSNYPSLVRGSNSTLVVGQTVESTQVLVVYYLLRELLKRQINAVKATIQKDSIISYLDAFEKYTAGANLVKPIFTYLHWTWQKRGLPAEHVIQPTEIVVGHLWLDVILTAELKESYRAKVNQIVSRVRAGGATSVSEMESVKRFSLNLGCATDVRLILYSSIIEETYVRSLMAYYLEKKQSYKKLGVVEYINQCVRAVKKEDVLARCFLIRSSYDQVNEAVLRILIHEEKSYLHPFCHSCLDLANGNDPVSHKPSLLALYNLLGGGEAESWMEGLLKATVTQYAADALRATADAGEPAVVLRVLRSALHTYEGVIAQVFGSPARLHNAVYDGIAANMTEYEATGDNAAKLAKRLARCTAEEVKTASPSELAATGNWISVLYRLCSKQDVFHQAFTRLLQERLLTNMFSLEKQADFAAREESLLSSILVKDTNFGFVFNCMRMVNDANRSDRRAPERVGQLPVKRYVLGAYDWGETRRSSEADPKQIPLQLQGIVANNIRMYEATKTGRKLLFAPEHSGCRVKMTLPGSTAPLTLIVSLLQARYLLAMNKMSEWSVDALCAQTLTTREECHRALNPFLQTSLLDEAATDAFVLHKRLEEAQNTSSGSAELKSYDLRCIEFNSQQNHARKNTVFMREDKSYTLSIEGATVKYLKELGPLSLEAIMTHVSTNLERLAVQRRDIKKVLEKLIERQFVQRNGQLFSFIP